MNRSLTINKYLPKTTFQEVLPDGLFLQLLAKVFTKRPQLKNIIKQYGNLSLYEYAKRYNEPNSAMKNEQRRAEFTKTFTEEVKRLLGDDVANDCKKQLSEIYRVTTTDHHGPLSTSIMLNSNILESIPYLEGDDIVKNIIVLGCANISFNNYSFPRGLLFHSYENGSLTQNQLSFFSRATDSYPLIYFPSYTEENIKKLYIKLDEYKRDKIITNLEEHRLKKIIKDVYADPSVLSSGTFSDQVSKTNFLLWKEVMQDNPKAPNLVYVELEMIINKLLDAHHLDQKTLIHKLLFTQKYHDLLLKYFDGILRCFSIKDKKGTFLFWALPNGRKHRVQLWKKGKFLQTDDGSYKIELSPKGLREAIRKNELIPSTLISFIILSFYYGIRLVGGKDQTTYLTEMKEAFIAMQKEYGDTDSIELLQELRTDDLSITVNSLAYLQTPQKKNIPSTSIDLILYGHHSTFSTMKILSEVLTLKEIIYRALPDYYAKFYKEEEQEPHLANITKEHLEKYLGLDNIIIPSAKIS